MSSTICDDTTATATVPTTEDAFTETALREELEEIEAILHAIQYRAGLMDAVLSCSSRLAAEAYLTSTTQMTAVQVARLMNVPFGDLTKDRREALDARRGELKRLLERPWPGTERPRFNR